MSWIYLSFDVAQWQDIGWIVMKNLVLVRRNIYLLVKQFYLV